MDFYALFYWTGVAFWLVPVGFILILIWYWISIAVAFTYAYSGNNWAGIKDTWRQNKFWKIRIFIEMLRPSNCLDALGTIVTTGLFKVDCTGIVPKVVIFDFDEGDSDE